MVEQTESLDWSSWNSITCYPRLPSSSSHSLPTAGESAEGENGLPCVVAHEREEGETENMLDGRLYRPVDPLLCILRPAYWEGSAHPLAADRKTQRKRLTAAI